MDDATDNNFSPQQSDEAARLAKLHAKGEKYAVLFGRFQPLHKGHVEMIRRIIASGLELHVIVNSKVDTPDERNPYSYAQRKEIFKRELGDEIKAHKLHLHEIKDVYLGQRDKAGNPVETGEGVRTLKTFIRDNVGSLNKTVIFYAEKNEDKKAYLMDGFTCGDDCGNGIHYIDLLTDSVADPKYDNKSRPELLGLERFALAPVQMNGQTMHASKVRDEMKKDDNTTGWNKMLSDGVRTYILSQEELALRNGRTVGGPQKHDQPMINGAAEIKTPNLTREEFLDEMRKLNKEIVEQPGKWAQSHGGWGNDAHKGGRYM